MSIHRNARRTWNSRGGGVPGPFIQKNGYYGGCYKITATLYLNLVADGKNGDNGTVELSIPVVVTIIRFSTSWHCVPPYNCAIIMKRAEFVMMPCSLRFSSMKDCRTSKSAGLLPKPGMIGVCFSRKRRSSAVS